MHDVPAGGSLLHSPVSKAGAAAGEWLHHSPMSSSSPARVSLAAAFAGVRQRQARYLHDVGGGAGAGAESERDLASW